MTAKDLYAVLGPSFRKQGYRVTRSGKVDRLLQLDQGQSVRLVEYMLLPDDLICDCGVTWLPAALLIERLQLLPMEATSLGHALGATVSGNSDLDCPRFGWDSDSDSPRELAPSLAGVSEDVWSWWEACQPWLERASDPDGAREILIGAVDLCGVRNPPWNLGNGNEAGAQAGPVGGNRGKPPTKA